MDQLHNTLDDRHEYFNPYRSQCCKCKYFIRDGYTCKIYPHGIPLDIPLGIVRCNEQAVEQTESDPGIEQ